MATLKKSKAAARAAAAAEKDSSDNVGALHPEIEPGHQSVCPSLQDEETTKENDTQEKSEDEFGIVARCIYKMRKKEKKKRCDFWKCGETAAAYSKCSISQFSFLFLFQDLSGNIGPTSVVTELENVWNGNFFFLFFLSSLLILMYFI
jgi:hypothetical protein